MKDIKIFVSHRIDKESMTIKNPIYVPVKCGAVFDDKQNTDIIGDNTGVNISDKRMSFCELTVLYWAWKNQKADYYGLCHYRRYLSFSDDISCLSNTEHDQGCISVSNLSDEIVKKYHLNERDMRSKIENYDAIFIKPIDLKKLNIKSNYEAMLNSPDYHNIEDVDKMLNIIKRKYPKMYSIAYDYMYKEHTSFLYNCFIMKSNIFNNFCSWLFDILFELEKEIDMSRYSLQQYRALGTIGERLLGIYELYLRKQKKYKLGYNDLLFIQDTDVDKKIAPAFDKNNIAIVSNFNDAYAPVFSVFLSSAIEHSSKNMNYDFIILSDDISEKHKRMLLSQCKNNVSIRFYNVKKYLEDLKLNVRHNVYSIDLYYRIIIPNILDTYNKILVVDADMICQEDLSNVYHEDIDSYLAGGCIDTVLQGYLNGADPDFLPYAKKYMHLSNPYQYINTGLLLFNAKKYREVYSLEFLKSFINQHMEKVKIYEQDMLNMLLDTKIKFLDPKWNKYTKSNTFINKCFNLSPYESYKKYQDIITIDNGITHYAAHPKPWWDTNVDNADLWWKYARKSPCYEELLQILISKTVDIKGLRSEFENFHFPNINNRFSKLECMILNHIHHTNLYSLRFKRVRYRIKQFLFFWKYKKYEQKIKQIDFKIKMHKGEL